VAWKEKKTPSICRKTLHVPCSNHRSDTEIIWFGMSKVNSSKVIRFKSVLASIVLDIWLLFSNTYFYFITNKIELITIMDLFCFCFVRQGLAM
jgi:hypothetical protein